MKSDEDTKRSPVTFLTTLYGSLLTSKWIQLLSLIPVEPQRQPALWYLSFGILSVGTMDNNTIYRLTGSK